MSVSHKVKWAENYLKYLHSEDKAQLQSICRAIQLSEDALLQASSSLMQSCIESCGGICCKNLHLETVFAREDFVFIFALQKNIKKKIAEVLPKENPFITQDCIFLQNQNGPCMFPGNLRPLVCITTFCQRDNSVKKELRDVRNCFGNLNRFVALRFPRSIWRWLKRERNQKLVNRFPS